MFWGKMQRKFSLVGLSEVIVRQATQVHASANDFCQVLLNYFISHESH
jgi:hypothetical protein